MEKPVPDEQSQSLEQKAVESENAELRKQKLFDKVLVNKKRTFKLFQGGIMDQDDQALNQMDQILQQDRLKTKQQRQYADIGHVSGILVPLSQRNKVLKDLGITESHAPLSGADRRAEELKVGPGKVASPKSQDKAASSPQTKGAGTQALVPVDAAQHPGGSSQKVNAKDQTTALSLISAINTNEFSIALRHKKQTEVQWHAPWTLKRVISGHTGWVRCIAVDPMNKFFVTGSNDRTIKFWDLVSGTLKITLTGHINTVRGLAVSDRHPYLFSCGEDKTVKCWDLEQNKVVRQYHGHLSGVYALALHPQLDLLVTGGRDSTARVWDMRTKAEVHVLGGHSHTIESIICQADEPQIITGSHDKMIRMWDIRTGSTIKTLTQHKKGVRALANHHEEHAFASAGSDKIRIWKQPEGDQLRTLADHNAVINSLALNEDNVLVSGADNGSLHFHDWKSGHCFQRLQSPVQPGSLSSEAAIFDIKFDRSSLRMITAECDKSIKIWKEDETATPETHPIVQEYA